MLKQVISRYLALMAALSLIATSILAIPQVAFAGQYDFPSGDCDNNAVMRCGVRNVKALKHKYRQNQNGDTQAIFAKFGMDSASDFNGMVHGTVQKDGDVYVDGKRVAKDAVTAGRHHMPGSTKLSGVDAYQRPPKVSFRSNSIPALVKLNSHGQFKYAVIMSCGNPVKAKNVVKREKKEEPKITGEFQCDTLTATLHDESEHSYKFEATSSGEHADVKEYVFHFGDGNKETVNTDEFTAETTHSYSEPGEYDAKVLVRADVMRDGKKEHTARSCATTVHIEEEEEPEPEITGDLQCDSLTATEAEKDHRSYIFEATASGENADVQEYEFHFGDGTTETVETSELTAEVQHRYEADATYEPEVIVKGEIPHEGSTKQVSRSCTTTVHVQGEQPEPEPGVKDLSIEKYARVQPDGDWADVSASADPGAEVEYRIVVTNTGDETLENVYVHDTLPVDANYEDTQVLQGSSGSNSFTIGDLVGDGITITSMEPGEELEIIFTVTIDENTDACEVPMRNVARTHADDVEEVEDDVNLTVCQPAPEAPHEEPHEEEEPVEEEEPAVLSSVDEPAGKGELPATGAAGAIGLFSVSSMFGLAAYKLKEFFLLIMR